jgi:hypothetical protein
MASSSPCLSLKQGGVRSSNAIKYILPKKDCPKPIDQEHMGPLPGWGLDHRLRTIFLHISYSSDLFHFANGMIIFPLSLFGQTLHSKKLDR